MGCPSTVDRLDTQPIKKFPALVKPLEVNHNVNTSPLFYLIGTSLNHLTFSHPLTLVRSKAWTVVVCSNTGIVGSNPTWGMNVCAVLFGVCVVLCVRSGLATGWSPVQGVVPTVYRIKKLTKRPRSKGLQNHREKWNSEIHFNILAPMPRSPKYSSVFSCSFYVRFKYGFSPMYAVYCDALVVFHGLH
jgi:hypothetical protein